MVKRLARDLLDEQGKLDRDIANDSYSKLSERKNQGSYEYLPNYSNENTSVYKDGNKIKIGMRGSTTKGDWARNVALMPFGQENYDKDFTADRALYDTLKRDFSDSEISTTGHSRGGKRARNLAFKKGVKGTAFNEASSPLSVSQSYQKNYCESNDCKEFKAYNTKNDPVSGLGKSSGQYGTSESFDTDEGNTIVGSHSLKNFY
jgi:hypothetical protein